MPHFSHLQLPKTNSSAGNMSHGQGQPKRPQANEFAQLEPIKYGDIFDVSGELASKPIPPQDAAAMQAAENRVLGHTQLGSPAVAMKAAAVMNERAGLVSQDDMTDIAKNQGITVSETKGGGGTRIITEGVGGQVLGHDVVPDEPMVATDLGSAAIDGDPITIGEALEAVVISAGDKPVDQSDAAAITAAEFRATGKNQTTAGGVGEVAQSAATHNTHVLCGDEMTKLSDVLTDATEKMVKDKAVTKEDAEAVYAAEVQFPWRRDNPEAFATRGGVAASMATAAELNKDK